MLTIYFLDGVIDEVFCEFDFKIVRILIQPMFNIEKKCM